MGGTMYYISYHNLALTLQEHKEFTTMISGELPQGWADALPSPTPEDKGKATRLHSQDCLNALASVIPGLPCS